MSNPGKFVWYELLTSDASAAENFYKHVIGWGSQDAGHPEMKYTLLTVNQAPVAGMMTTPEGCSIGLESLWGGYILVDDVDRYAGLVKDAGGKINMDPQDIPNVGRFAVAADPQGAAFTLFKPSMDDRGDQFPTPPTPGTIGWHELHTTNWEDAFKFYSGLFGWTKDEALDMGPMGTYQLFAAGGGAAIGGMMKSMEPSSPPVWRYYICVDNIDAAEARLKEKGGEVVFGPQEVPGGAWIIQARDPQGVFFAVVGPRK